MPRTVIPTVFLLFASLSLTGCPAVEKSPVGGSPRLSTSTEVKLTIDTGDPKVTTAKFPYTEKMTVLDVLVQAEAQGISSVIEGQGEGAMIKSIAGISNQGAGKEAKNWIFYVNGKPANVSSAVYSLQPGDAIIWRFEKYE